MPLFHERSGAFSREKTFFLLLSVLPALWLAWLAASGGLGPRPWTEAIHFTGLWAIRFLVLTLAVTPLRRLLAAPKLFFGRRILGLAALAYALAHVTLFFIDQGVVRAASEIALRIYLTIGAVAVALLIALGATSTDGALHRLGARRWNLLHRAVYVIAVLAALHFFIQSKLDVTEPVLVTGALVLLFLYRIAFKVLGEVKPVAFALLSLAAAVLTGFLEMTWYGLATRVDPWLVAEANFSFDLGPRPVWWVLAGGVAVALLAALRQRAAPRRANRPARSHA
ncbi:protein-methionine-sulfoxide reductase heme-binding subunit MsrQ [Xanthobacter sediminis]|uniref:sulfite oxidase heme-binding subunit YedZ n=1 Tax=Xanthobacter sediminis TaxID=3119926 RepID=UPI003729B7B4